MIKIFKILKIAVIVFLIGAGIYLLSIKNTHPTKISEGETETSSVPQKQSLIGKDGTYTLADERVQVDISLPSSEEKYTESVLAYGEEQIQRFVSDEDEFKNIQSASFPWDLVMDYKTYESDTIISYVVEGYEYTGGAHGNTFVKSFNFDKTTGKEILISDLVASPQTFKTLSSLAKKELVVEYPEGLDENPENWSVWYADESSVTFLFMPYQIAPYAVGQQAITIDTQKEKNLFQEKYFQ